MLTSLGIRNYRNLRSLDIERLARVNLIAGKNNTGKTSLLEAVSLYAAKGDIQWIDELLTNRGEFYSNDSTLENNRRTYTSLFYARKWGFSDGDNIVIGPLEDILVGFKDPWELHKSLSIRFTKMIKEVVDLVEQKTGRPSINTRWHVVEDEKEEPESYRVALAIHFERDDSQVYILDDIQRERLIHRSYKYFEYVPNYHFVQTYYEQDNYTKWSNITLTENEKYIIKALQIIEPSVQKFAFVKDNDKQKAVIKLKDNPDRVPLQSMGDGMNHILTIILALVNASDGYLLIDEFENGLHYTVQENLWKMVFTLAKELNVQVFATTHSDDCIRAFESILNSDSNQLEGQYFRLERFGDVIKPIFYSSSELEVAAEQNIETR